jgi:hypothetical protein
MAQPLAGRLPDGVETLDDLASLMWDLDAPGLQAPATATA